MGEGGATVIAEYSAAKFSELDVSAGLSASEGPLQQIFPVADASRDVASMHKVERILSLVNDCGQRLARREPSTHRFKKPFLLKVVELKVASRSLHESLHPTILKRGRIPVGRDPVKRSQ